MNTYHYLLLVSAVIGISSCADGPNARTGTAVGALGGAAAGGIIGHQSGHALEGAAIGAGAGAVAGNAIGDAQDQRNERLYDSRRDGYYRRMDAGDRREFRRQDPRGGYYDSRGQYRPY